MAKDRETIPIKEVCEGIYDGPHATPKPADAGPIFLGIKNIREDGMLDLSNIRHISEEDYPKWVKRVKPTSGDIVFSYEATLNRYAIIPKGFRGCLGRRMALIRPNNTRISTRFLYYYFFSNEWRSVVSQNTLIGSTVDRIPLTQFPDFPIIIPPLDEQTKIAAILSAYDDLIENNLRRIKILEDMAQNLYREWFVNFRFPGHEQNRFVDSPSGHIPEGWEVKRLGDLVKIYRGKSYRSIDLAEKGGAAFINLKCIQRDGGFKREGIKRYIGSFNEKHTVKEQDIIIAVTDMTQERRIIAHAARIPYLDESTSIISMDLVKVVPINQLNEAFFFSLFRFSSFSDEVKQFANGANVLHLNPKYIEDYRIVLPDKQLRDKFEEICNAKYKLMDAIYDKNSVLRETRDLLLPKLISGEIDVSELDINMPEEVAI